MTIYVDPSARVAALAVAIRHDGDVIDRLRTTELPELLEAALMAIPVTRRQRDLKPEPRPPRWRSTCTVLHDAAVWGYMREGMQRCHLCDKQISERRAA